MLNFLLYFFGLLPSSIWLLFYLRKDSHPEPVKTILKVFILGMFSAIFAIIVEGLFQDGIGFIGLSKNVNEIIFILLGVAFVEEISKYLVVRIWVYKSPELDEVFDLILYMIISALGFAAMENTLMIISIISPLTFSGVFDLMTKRFLTATILHALCSGVFGYFMVLSFYRTKHRKILFFTGLLLATLFHGVYDLAIEMNNESERAVIVLFILIFLLLFIGHSMKKVKKINSVCLLE